MILTLEELSRLTPEKRSTLFAPPLKEAVVAAFEKRLNISLPDDYRRVLTTLGNGSPKLGLFGLGEYYANGESIPWLPNGDLVGDVTAEFPHVSDWNPFLGKSIEEHDQITIQCNDTKYLNGAIPIFALDGMATDWLVLNGPERGNVWFDERNNNSGISRRFDIEGNPISFDGWLAEHIGFVVAMEMMSSRAKRKRSVPLVDVEPQANPVGDPLIGQSQIEKASQIEGELTMLSAVVDDLRDDRARLDYADWLESKGESERAIFCRALAGSVQNPESTDLPEFAGSETAWTNMLGLPLLRGIEQLGLQKHARAILASAKPMLILTPEDVCANEILEGLDPPENSVMPLGASKFGGHPDLPEHVDWPQCSAGRMGFLTQFNLAELSGTLACRSLPESGMISVFVFRGEFPEDRVEVIYSEAADTLRRCSRPEDLDDDHNEVLAPYKLVVSEALDLPRSDASAEDDFHSDPLHEILKPFEQDDDLAENLGELRQQLHPGKDHLMGYQIQRTMFGDQRPGPEWEHLICLGGHGNQIWTWGDGDHLALFVHREDIANKSFKRTFISEG